MPPWDCVAVTFAPDASTVPAVSGNSWSVQLATPPPTGAPFASKLIVAPMSCPWTLTLELHSDSGPITAGGRRAMIRPFRWSFLVGHCYVSGLRSFEPEDGNAQAPGNLLSCGMISKRNPVL